MMARGRWLLATLLLCTAVWGNGGAPARDILVADLPAEARQTLALIHSGGPFPYAKDGVVFGNYEGALPKRTRGYYTEYTVRTPRDRTRGPRRIVAGKGKTGDPGTSGEYWYTDDHYASFSRIRE
jgi:ribonuclease T1